MSKKPLSVKVIYDNGLTGEISSIDFSFEELIDKINCCIKKEILLKLGNYSAINPQHLVSIEIIKETKKEPSYDPSDDYD